jgi:hypothetical protein
MPSVKNPGIETITKAKQTSKNKEGYSSTLIKNINKYFKIKISCCYRPNRLSFRNILYISNHIVAAKAIPRQSQKSPCVIEVS